MPSITPFQLHLSDRHTCAASAPLLCLHTTSHQYFLLPLLPEFPLFASTLRSQLAQPSFLSPAKQPICKDRGRGKDEERGKKERERSFDGNDRGKKKRDCFHNADCQELHSRLANVHWVKNHRVKLISFHIPAAASFPIHLSAFQPLSFESWGWLVCT